MSEPDRTAGSSLPANLRLAASYLPSVSQLCRDIGLNRQQVNKYLAGVSRPSPYNLRRIAAYLGLEPDELKLPAHRFAEVWRQRSVPPSGFVERRGCPSTCARPSSSPRRGSSASSGPITATSIPIAGRAMCCAM